MRLTRRTLLQTGPVAGAGMAFSSAAGAADGPHDTVSALRQRWADGAEAFLVGVLGADRATAADPLVELSRGVAAVDIAKELERLEPAAQAAPPVQALARDVLAAVGQSALHTAAALEAWLAPGGDRDDPDGRHVRGVLGAIRIGMRDANTTASRKAQVDGALGVFLDTSDPRHLRAEARRALRRTRKAEALAHHLAADPDARARVFGLDPDQIAALGIAPPKPGDEDPDAHSDDQNAFIVLGMLALGVVLVFGLALFLYGGCIFVCAAPGPGIGVMLLAAALMTIAIVGLRNSGKRWRRAEDDTPPPPTDPLGALRRPAPLGWVAVPARGGWVPAPDAPPAHARLCLAWGLVQTDRAWPADPDGDGVAAGVGAPLPGAPAGALIGRVGSRVFFIGAEAAVPPGLDGPLELAINLAPAVAAHARGGLEVQLLSAAPAPADA